MEVNGLSGLFCNLTASLGHGQYGLIILISLSHRMSGMELKQLYLRYNGLSNFDAAFASKRTFVIKYSQG